MPRNKKTIQIADGLALTTSYQNVTLPTAAATQIGSIFAHGGQVVLSFKRTNGTSITFKVDELFSYLDSSGNEVVGWATRKEVDSAGTGMDDIEITEADSTFHYAFTTMADSIRVQVKGAGSEELDLLVSVGEIT